jgi:NitT/TauT family transport system substrate-binding protein
MRRSALLLALLTVACRSEKPGAEDAAGRIPLRVGYFPNLTHAPALVGFQGGIFQEAVGDQVVLKGLAFPAGPQLIEGLFAGELDVAYVGPNPAINGFQRSRGKALRVIAGCTSGGAALVVRQEIAGPADLAGKTVSSPALGNTQDVALRIWLRKQGLRSVEDGGDVRIRPAPPADILGLFQRGDLAGAWVPEPWSSRLVVEANGKVLVDERSLWPGGVFPTTVVIASQDFLEARPEVVRRFLAGHAKAVALLAERPEQARELVGQRIYEELKVRLPPAVISRAYEQLAFTLDPMEEQLRRVAEEAHSLGFIKSAATEGLVDRSFVPAAAPGGSPAPAPSPRPGPAAAPPAPPSP